MEVQNSLERLYSKSKAIHTVREIETKRERERGRERGSESYIVQTKDKPPSTPNLSTNPHPNGQSD